MANWAWPHTPASNCARLVLTGGPFDGEEAAFVPPDMAAPAQIVWGGWFPWGFSAYLYEWHGETTTDRGRTDALLYRPPVWQNETLRVGRGRRLGPDVIPSLIAEGAETWADGAELLLAVMSDRLGRDVLWPGL